MPAIKLQGFTKGRLFRYNALHKVSAITIPRIGLHLQQVEKPEIPNNLAAALECLLFLAKEPLLEEEIARMLEVELPQAQAVIAELAGQCDGRGLQVLKIAGGWQLCTRPEYAPFIARMHEPEQVKLSRAALETLAIIAYRQPITRPEIEAIRGVSVDGVVTKLMGFGLIEELGRKEAPGRPMLYGTTKEFLSHFGISSVEELPELPEPDEKTVAEIQQSVPAAEQPASPREEKIDEPLEQKS